LFNFIAKPFGFVIQYIYNSLAFENYGIAIIFFTIFVRILLLPLAIKQQKSMLMTQKIQPEIDAINKNYAGDREKIQEETSKLYSKYKVNPMSSCLPLLLQFPIIIALYSVIRKPLTYIMGISAEAITKLGEFVGNATGGAALKDEIKIKDFFLQNTDKLPSVSEWISRGKLINMNFLGMNMGTTPAFNPGKITTNLVLYLPLLLIPILAAVTTFIQTKVTMAGNKNRKGEEAKPATQAQSMTKSMNYIMPFFTMFIAFTVPAGLGFYWIISNIFAIGQTVLINKMVQSKEEVI
jgi:YidC/Oxa1 family membrane protein insertase